MLTLEQKRTGNLKQHVGLLDGLAGMAVTYYLQAKWQRNDTWQKQGLSILDEISERIGSVQNFQFQDGLAGIGWAVEWLVQHDLLDNTNTDEVLSEVDDILYRSIVYSRDINFSLLTGTCGKIAYLNKRIASKNPDPNRLRQICHNECVVILTDDLQEKLVQENGFEQLPVTELSNILVQMVMIPPINRITIEAILYEAAKHSLLLLSKIANAGASGRKAITVNDYHNFLYLGVCLLIAAQLHEHKYWELQARSCIKQLLQMGEKYERCGKEQLFKRLSIYSLLNIYDPALQLAADISKIIDTLSAKPLPACLYNGTGTVMLANMCLQSPQLISDWHELFFIKG